MSKRIPRTRNSYEDATCKGCGRPLEIGEEIYAISENRWQAACCARKNERDARIIDYNDSARRRTAIETNRAERTNHGTTITRPTRPDGWEHDKNHRPHSMSQPCATCDKLFGKDA